MANRRWCSERNCVEGKGCEIGLGLLGDGWRHARNNLTVAALDLPLQTRCGDVDGIEYELGYALAEHVSGDCECDDAGQG